MAIHLTHLNWRCASRTMERTLYTNSPRLGLLLVVGVEYSLSEGEIRYFRILRGLTLRLAAWMNCDN